MWVAADYFTNSLAYLAGSQGTLLACQSHPHSQTVVSPPLKLGDINALRNKGESAGREGLCGE